AEQLGRIAGHRGPSMKRFRRPRPELLLGLIIIVAAGLRTWHLGAQSYWIDECFSLECTFGHNYAHLALPRNQPIWPVPSYLDVRSAQPWWRIPFQLDHDLHPPLAYLMLRGWGAIFGYSEAGARSLSL